MAHDATLIVEEFLATLRERIAVTHFGWRSPSERPLESEPIVEAGARVRDR